MRKIFLPLILAMVWFSTSAFAMEVNFVESFKLQDAGEATQGFGINGGTFALAVVGSVGSLPDGDGNVVRPNNDGKITKLEPIALSTHPVALGGAAVMIVS